MERDIDKNSDFILVPGSGHDSEAEIAAESIGLFSGMGIDQALVKDRSAEVFRRFTGSGGRYHRIGIVIGTDRSLKEQCVGVLLIDPPVTRNSRISG